jgi:trans-2,3-dihydro-3-hydroxyanthranilate isomerase
MRHCYVLRVFTRGDEGGNHLGVVTDVTGLETDSMQEIATELGFSETIFIDWRSEGIPFVRIFTPAAEMPFAGHPLVGAAWTLGVAGPGTTDRVECQVGEIPFRVDDETVWVDTPMVTDVSPAPDGPEIAAASGLETTGRCWWARMPIPYLVVEAPSAEAVAAARPDFEGLLAGPAGEATYLFARDGGTVKARFFAAGLGVPEDPATGSAAAALAAVLAHEGEIEGTLMVNQGDETGHPSTIHLVWSPAAVSLGGTVRRDEVRVLDT